MCVKSIYNYNNEILYIYMVYIKYHDGNDIWMMDNQENIPELLISENFIQNKTVSVNDIKIFYRERNFKKNSKKSRILFWYNLLYCIFS